MLLLQKFQNSALCDATDISTSAVHTTAMFVLLKVGNYKIVYCLKALKKKDVHTNIRKNSSLVLKV